MSTIVVVVSSLAAPILAALAHQRCRRMRT
jgi:hypothetical protein